MKHMKIFLLIGLVLGITSCGYNVSNPDDIIVGTYVVTSLVVSGCDDPANNDPGSLHDFDCYIEDQYQICNSISLEFTNDRGYELSRNTRTIDQVIGTVLHENDPLEGYYFIDGNRLRICFNGSCQDASFNLEGNQLTLQIQQGEGCIQTIQATKL